jgi:hypothetical protein
VPVLPGGGRLRRATAPAGRDARGQATGELAPPAKLRREVTAGEDQRGQVDEAEHLRDRAEDQKRYDRMCVGRVDELAEERHEEQDRLRVQQADGQGSPECARFDRGIRLRRYGVPLVTAVPVTPRAADQAVPDVAEVGGAGVLHDVEQHRLGPQQ